jgi:hypothetical protein
MNRTFAEHRRHLQRARSQQRRYRRTGFMTNAPDPVSEPVRGFLMNFVHTFEELEILLLLHCHAPEPFDPERVHHALEIPEDAALSALDALADRGLLRKGADTSRSFVYAPHASLCALVSELADVHAQALFAIVEIMSANALIRLRSSAIQRFGQAFHLRRHPPKK